MGCRHRSNFLKDVSRYFWFHDRRSKKDPWPIKGANESRAESKMTQIVQAVWWLVYWKLLEENINKSIEWMIMRKRKNLDDEYFKIFTEKVQNSKKSKKEPFRDKSSDEIWSKISSIQTHFFRYHVVQTFLHRMRFLPKHFCPIHFYRKYFELWKLFFSEKYTWIIILLNCTCLEGYMQGHEEKNGQNTTKLPEKEKIFLKQVTKTLVCKIR